jgi:ATP adenylyltransferase/5',5'''-P-1,P-4-tetraphosphate phosphorylase II
LTINSSSEAIPKDTAAASKEEVESSPKLNEAASGESDMYNSTRSSDHIIDASATVQAPDDNTTPGMLAGFCHKFIVNLWLLIISKVSIENKSDHDDEGEVEEPEDVYEFEEFEDNNLESDSEDEFEVYVNTFNIITSHLLIFV